MRIRSVGAYALLLDCDGPDQVQAWRAELWRRRAAGELSAAEIVPAAATVLVDGVPDPAAAAARIARWTPRADAAPADAAEVEVPTVYDGADLPVVRRPTADLSGRPPDHRRLSGDRGGGRRDAARAGPHRDYGDVPWTSTLTSARDSASGDSVTTRHCWT